MRFRQDALAPRARAVAAPKHDTYDRGPQNAGQAQLGAPKRCMRAPAAGVMACHVMPHHACNTGEDSGAIDLFRLRSRPEFSY